MEPWEPPFTDHAPMLNHVLPVPTSRWLLRSPLCTTETVCDGSVAFQELEIGALESGSIEPQTAPTPELATYTVLSFM